MYFSHTQLLTLYHVKLTEWWIMLSGGDNDDRHGKSANGSGVVGDGKRATASITIISIAIIITVIAVSLIFLWNRWSQRSSTSVNTTADTTMAASNLIGTNTRVVERGEKPNKKYSLFSQHQQQPQQWNIYPNLSSSERGDSRRSTTTDTIAPDIMIQQNYGKQFLVSIANRGIPGPESCV